MKKYLFPLIVLAILCSTGCSCIVCKAPKSSFTGVEGEVKILTLDPGHFHAALVQKSMYKQVNPVVHVYAPEGADAQDHLNRIKGFNSRAESPTAWEEKLYTGDDFLEKMIAEKKGNVVVTSGNNSKKTDYIYKAVEGGLNVLADKPMVISPDKFDLLVEAFEKAEERGVLMYDVMTERHEINTMLQKELANTPYLFGQLQKGTPDKPGITKESVHHFFKYVAGNPIKRPAWFFDPSQRGEGLVDVSTHLVDLVQWECFPGQIINYKKDIEILSAKRWGTEMTLDEFKKVTRLDGFPKYLKPYLKGNKLNAISNGEMIYKIKDVHAKVSVVWNYQAPDGTGDTHYSIMRGSKCNLIIQQGKDEGYKPTLYVEALDGKNIEASLDRAVNEDLQKKYPGISFEKVSSSKWKLNIPQKYHIGHEAHFAQVTKKYLGYLVDGKLPEWEVPNMIAKYYTTTQALKKINDEILSVKIDDKALVNYQAQAMSAPKGNEKFPAEKFKGSNFIHPLKTPSGFVITDLQPHDHPHHFGLWWPWKYIVTEGRKVLCWELQEGDGIVSAVESKLTDDGFTAKSVYTDRRAVGGPKTLLNETINVKVSEITDKPASGYYLDIEIIHDVEGDKPLEVMKYRYSGFSIRATAEWTKDNSTVLTSEGKDYSESNFTRAKWVRVEGAAGDISKAGFLMMSRADNHDHPERLRTWDPKTHNGAIFININTVQDESWVFEPGKEYKRNFRLFIYDGAITAEQAEGLWRKYKTEEK